MIEITPFDVNSNGYQPDFYLHGNLVKDNDKVCILDNVYNDRIHTYYYKNKPLPMTIIDIPEGIHLCNYGNILCALFTWKVTLHTTNGIVGDSKCCYNFDTWVRQNGLIVDINDTKTIEDALAKYLNKSILI